jgi:hypothetical protein
MGLPSRFVRPDGATRPSLVHVLPATLPLPVIGRYRARNGRVADDPVAK